MAEVENTFQTGAQYITHTPSDIRSEDLTVSIVICTCNKPATLLDCLKALAKLEPQPDEIIVVDNTTGNIETQQLAEKFRTRYVREANRGLSRARNRGMLESKSDIVAFIDDDAFPLKNWLEFLLAPFKDSRVAVVTGGIVAKDLPVTALDADPHRSLSKMDNPWFQVAAFGGLGIGANMALRKSACTDQNVFDLRLGRGALIRGGEESHAFIQLIDSGFRAVHVPTAAVIHDYKPLDVRLEAGHAIAYWLFLFVQFPQHRRELLSFLIARLRRKPLTWYRSSPDFGPIITSGWPLRVRATLAGLRIFLRLQKESNPGRVCFISSESR
jgi:glycosyltransferase involved in cell wall biosynthesis